MQASVRGRRTNYQADASGEGRKHRPDYVLVLLSMILASVGMVVIYSISPAIGALSGEEPLYYFTRHAIALGIGIIGMAVIYAVRMKHMLGLAYVLAALSVIGSILILILDGVAFRWIKIAGFSFQPSEMMKLGLLLWLAYFLTRQKMAGKLRSFKETLRPVLYVVASLGIVVVVLQRDLGSMLVLAAITGLMLFIASVPMRPLILLFAGLVALSAIAIASTPYRRDRFETFLNPERDCQNEGYHACQALIAVGSGGLVGLGVGNSVQAYGYLPETPTDSIFAVYAEKFGFIGSVLIVGVVGLLLLRLFKIAGRSTSWEARLIVSGIIAWLGVQSMINIGAMLGLLPLKGITLPFVSYGGSSLIFVFLALGVALRISCYTSMRTHQLEEGPNNEDSTNGRGNRRTYNAPLGGRGGTSRH
jgi:cell division protein FtsW